MSNNITNFKKLLKTEIDKIILSIDNIKINNESNSLNDTISKILIDISAADTIKQILDDFDKLKSFDIFENDNVKEVQDLLNRLDNLGGASIIENSNIEKIEELLNKLDTLSKENIYLIINTNLDEQIKNLKQVKIDIYNPNCLDDIKASIIFSYTTSLSSTSLSCPIVAVLIEKSLIQQYPLYLVFSRPSKFVIICNCGKKKSNTISLAVSTPSNGIL